MEIRCSFVPRAQNGQKKNISDAIYFWKIKIGRAPRYCFTKCIAVVSSTLQEILLLNCTSSPADKKYGSTLPTLNIGDVRYFFPK